MENNPLYKVFTIKEAEYLWDIGNNTVLNWIKRGRFSKEEYRQSGRNWLVTEEGMNRITGKERIRDIN